MVFLDSTLLLLKRLRWFSSNKPVSRESGHNLYQTGSFNVSTVQGRLIRPSDKATAQDIRTLASKIMDDSRLIQQIFSLINKQNMFQNFDVGAALKVG